MAPKLRPMRFLISFFLVCLVVLWTGRVLGHGGVAFEEDKCVINIGFLKAHFTAYQPQSRGNKEFCEDIPEVEVAVFVIDYLHDFLKKTPVDFRIIEDVHGFGVFANWEDIERLDDIECVVSMATGCGVTIKDYPHILRHDPVYARRAEQVVHKLVDAVELFTTLPVKLEGRVAVHTPCTMQHSLKLVGAIERLLTEAGAEIVPHRNGHLCCGSAGSYSMLEPERSRHLREDKITCLTANKPEVIVTANIGCQIHLDELLHNLRNLYHLYHRHKSSQYH